MSIISNGEAKSASGGIQLPFPVIYPYIVNGSAALEQAHKVLFCGGWIVGQDKMDELCKAEGRNVPVGWAKIKKINKDQTANLVYGTQNIYAAPIAFRQSWESENGGRSPTFYKDKTGKTWRQHIQYLCYLGEEIDDVLRPWGPLVLTVKGFQANYLDGAFRTFASKTKAARTAFGKPDARSFYTPVGTFGNEPAVEMKGSGDQSPITPIQTLVPKVMDANLMKTLYVSDDILGELNQLLSEADEWLNAWKTRQVAQEGEEMVDVG